MIYFRTGRNITGRDTPSSALPFSISSPHQQLAASTYSKVRWWWWWWYLLPTWKVVFTLHLHTPSWFFCSQKYLPKKFTQRKDSQIRKSISKNFQGLSFHWARQLCPAELDQVSKYLFLLQKSTLKNLFMEDWYRKQSIAVLVGFEWMYLQFACLILYLTLIWELYECG